MPSLYIPRHAAQRFEPWEAAEAVEMNKLLKYGDPTTGWEGEERLFLQLSDEDRWEVWRMCEDNVPRMICRSQSNQKLDKSLLIKLREHDSRRTDVRAEVDKHNNAVKKERDDKMHDSLMETTEKVYWGLSKDLHAHGGY